MNFEKYLELERQIEKDLDVQLTNLLALERNGNGTYEPKICFVTPTKSSRGLQHAPRSSKFQALTVLVFYKGDNTIPHYVYTVCDNEDQFSRVRGRAVVKEKAVKILQQQDLSSLPVVDNTLNNGIVVADYFRKIVNRIFSIESNKYAELNLDSKINTLESSADIIKRLNKLGMEVKFKHFNFPKNPFPLSPVKWSGGFTLVSITDPKTNETTVSASICVEGDNFNKETGRQLALLNFIQNKHEEMFKRVKKKFGNNPEVKEFLSSKGL